jgi:hypothetical protein
MTSSNKVPGLVLPRKYGVAHNPLWPVSVISYYDRQGSVESKRWFIELISSSRIKHLISSYFSESGRVFRAHPDIIGLHKTAGLYKSKERWKIYVYVGVTHW